MRFLFALAVLSLLPLASAHAAGYDDFARGVAANTQGDSEIAIAAFSTAIAAGDLSPALLPSAYRARALANLRLNKCAEALPDLGQAIALKAAYRDVRWLHARAAECLGKRDVALADMTALIAAKPDADAYFMRGRMQWYLADYAAAVTDFIQARQIDSQNALIVLWLEIARQRSGTLTADVAAADLDQLHTYAWPRPIVELYAGMRKSDDSLEPRTPPEEATEGQGNGTEESQANNAALPNRKCETDFYLGEYWASRHDLAAARPLLQHAAGECSPEAMEHDAASYELGRLK